MTTSNAPPVADIDELDVRQMPNPERHPLIFARFDGLAVDESFVLVDSEDPISLRQQFARTRPNTYEWRLLEGSRADQLWRIRIVRLAEAAV
jgi:uncharacterized protein (DUF2249 family)